MIFVGPVHVSPKSKIMGCNTSKETLPPTQEAKDNNENNSAEDKDKNEAKGKRKKRKCALSVFVFFFLMDETGDKGTLWYVISLPPFCRLAR